MKTNNVKRDALIACLCVSGVLTSADVSGERKLSTEMSPTASTPSSASMSRDPRAGLPEAPLRRLPGMTGAEGVFSTTKRNAEMNPFTTPPLERVGTPLNTTTEHVEEPKTPTRNFSGGSYVPATPVANRRMQLRHAPEKIESAFEREKKENSATQRQKNEESSASSSRGFAVHNLDKKPTTFIGNKNSEKPRSTQTTSGATLNQATRVGTMSQNSSNSRPLNNNGSKASTKQEFKSSKYPHNINKSEMQYTPLISSRNENLPKFELPKNARRVFSGSMFELIVIDPDPKEKADLEKMKRSRPSSRKFAAYDLNARLKDIEQKEAEEARLSQRNSNAIPNYITGQAPLNQAARGSTMKQYGSNSRTLGNNGDLLRGTTPMAPELTFWTNRFNIHRPGKRLWDLDYPWREGDEAAKMPLPKDLLCCFKGRNGRLITGSFYPKQIVQALCENDLKAGAEILLALKQAEYRLIAHDRIEKLATFELAPEFLKLFKDVVNRAELEDKAIKGQATVDQRYFSDNEVTVLLLCKSLLSLGGQTTSAKPQNNNERKKAEEIESEFKKDFRNFATALPALKKEVHKLIESNRLNELESRRLEPEFLYLFWNVVSRADLEEHSIIGLPITKRYFNNDEVLALRWCKPILSYLSGKIGMDELLKYYREEQAEKEEAEKKKESERKKLLEDEKRRAAAAAKIKQECDDKLRAVAEKRAARAEETQKANQGEMKPETNAAE